MFRKAADFEAFERVMVEAHQHEPIRILAYCTVSYRTIGILSSGRSATVNCRGSSYGRGCAAATRR